MNGWISPEGSYHENDPMLGSVEVPQRPSALHAWNGTEWAIDPAAFNADLDAQIAEIEQDSMMSRQTRIGLLPILQMTDSVAYQKMKAIDDQIAALRAQRL